jgi:hypothetical protein
MPRIVAALPAHGRHAVANGIGIAVAEIASEGVSSIMRTVSVLAVIIVCGLPATARAQADHGVIQGFGGLTFSSSSLVGTSTAPSVGAAVAARLTPNIQVVGAVGRLSDIKSPLFELLDFTPIDLGVSAWYGEGGLRLISSPGSVARPYAEATAGVARLRTSLSGLGDADPFVDAGLGLLNRTEPLFGIGGGVLLTAGPLAVDLGYRYKRIMASGVASALNAGDAFQVNEARVGIGIRF